MPAYYKIHNFAAIPAVGIGGALLSTLMGASNLRHGKAIRPPEWHIVCESMPYPSGEKYHMVFGRIQSSVAVRTAWNMDMQKKLESGSYEDTFSREAFLSMVGTVADHKAELEND